MYCTSCDRGNHVRLGGIPHRQLLYLLLLFPLEQQEAMTNNYLHLQKPKIQFQAAMTVMYQLHLTDFAVYPGAGRLRKDAE